MSYEPDITIRDKRGIRMAYIDTVYGAPMPVQCDNCTKHMTSAQYRWFGSAIGHDEEGLVWCSDRCHEEWHKEREETRARYRARGEGHMLDDGGPGEPPISAEERYQQAAAFDRALDSGRNY